MLNINEYIQYIRGADDIVKPDQLMYIIYKTTTGRPHEQSNYSLVA